LLRCGSFILCCLGDSLVQCIQLEKGAVLYIYFWGTQLSVVTPEKLDG